MAKRFDNSNGEAGEHRRVSISVAITFSTLFAESFLFVQDLRFGFFPLLFGLCVLLVIVYKNVVVDLFKWDIVFPVQVLRRRRYPVSTSETYVGDCTNDFTKQDHVFSSDEEQAMPAFRKGISVVYSLDGIFEYEVGCRRDR